MTQFKWFWNTCALLCMGLAAACTTGTDAPAGNTELNLQIMNPNGTSEELGFPADRVDYRITCDATVPEAAPIPPAQYTDVACTSDADCPLGSQCDLAEELCAIPYQYDDEVDITGQFEIVDNRVDVNGDPAPPVWQAVMDLPPGNCTVTLSVRDPNGDLVCSGSQTLLIQEDQLTKYDIVLVCSISVDLPDGMADIDGTFQFITGNLCPKLYTLNAIPSDIEQDASNPNAATEMQFRSKDPDQGCGSRCDPQLCSGANPPVCTPSPVNPADVRCNPLFGGGLTCGDTNAALPGYCPLCADTANFPPTANNPCCYGIDLSAGGGPTLPAATGLVCQLTAIATIDGSPAGTFISPADGTSPIGPVLPVNLSDPFSDGAGITIPGVDAEYRCDTQKPGPVVMNLDCTDGDNVCAQNKQYLVNCPGTNWCIDAAPGVQCDGSNDCLTDGLCDGTCDPVCDPARTEYDQAACDALPVAGANCDSCPGKDSPVGSGTACTSSGGQVCDGAGTCVQCLADAQCTDLPGTPDECQLPNTCDTTSNSCAAGGTAPAGTSCDRGGILGPGECNGSGIGTANCEFVLIDPAPVTKAITLGCTNNLTPDVSILPWELIADADPLVDGQPTSIAYTGTAIFTESFLDAGLAAVPGLNQAALQQGNRGGATIIPKAGLTGGDEAGLEIEPAPIPLTCDGGMNAGGSCTDSTDCPPVGYFNCTEVVVIPTIDGTSDACAACNALGAPKDTQCADNGFCIAQGGLPIPLDNVTGSYTSAVANAEGVRIGWDDQNTTLLCDSGTAQHVEGCVCTGQAPQAGGEVCVAPNPGGQVCAADVDCPAEADGQTCDTGTADPGGQACTEDADCPAQGQTCDTGAGTCNAHTGNCNALGNGCPDGAFGQLCVIDPDGPNACSPTDTCSNGAPTLDADGAYELAPASFNAPWQPNGLRVVVGVLQIALNCTMGIDGEVALGVPETAAPTPIEDLLQIGVQVQ